MKKLIAFACVVAMVGFAAHAQAAMKMGFKGGVNFADVSRDSVGDTSMRTGMQGGAFLAMKGSGRWGARIEALYVQKGFKQDFDVLGTTYEGTYKADYLEFPLLAVASFPAGEKFSVDLFAGPTLGFNIKGEAEAGGSTVDIKDQIESFEFGLDFGAGGEIAASASVSVVFDVRYSLGLSNIVKDAGDNESAKNTGIGIMAGLAFPIGAK